MKKGFLIMYVVLLLFLMIQGVAAISVTVEPNQIGQGDPVTISIQGLEDNSTLSLQLVGMFTISPGGDFTYETDNLTLPFTLKNGTFSVAMQNTEENILSVHKGDTEVKRVAPSHNGQYNVTQTGTIPAGTYDYIILAGTAAPGDEQVIATINLKGIKEGPRDSKITFNTTGINDGTITIRILVNDVQTLSKTIQIGNPAAVPAYTDTPVRTSSDSSSGGGGSSGNSYGAIYLPTPIMNVTTLETVIGQPTSLTMESRQVIHILDTPVPPVQPHTAPQIPNPTKTGFPMLPLVVSIGLVLFVLSRHR